jgi:hypothetical protein
VTDREMIEAQSHQMPLLTKVQVEQHELLVRVVAIQEQQDRHMQALAEAIHHLAERIGAVQ